MVHALVLGLLALPGALAWTPPPPIVNGSETDDYPAVGALVLENDGDMYGSYCSGTLVDRYWVITAAHCVEALNEDYRSYNTYFVIGGNLLQGEIDEYALVTQAIEFPSWNETSMAGDIGLLELDNDGENGGQGIRNTTPMPVNDDDVTSSWEGDDMRLVGFGITSDNNHNSGDIKRTADVPVWGYDSAFIYTFDQAAGQNACSGDSGGAGLEILGGSSFELAGIISFGWAPHGGQPCTDGALAMTRVDRYLYWIEDYVDLEADSDADTDTDPTWDTGTDDPKRPNDVDGTATDGWMGGCSVSPARTSHGLGLLLALLGLILAPRRRK